MRQIDITEHKLKYVNCSEGNIFFDAFTEGQKFEVKIWGVTLMKGLECENIDTYVAAMSNLEFEDVAYIHIDYGIYANEQGNGFIKNMQGDSTDLRLELGKKDNLSGYVEYVIGGILGRYAGYGEITIYCKGEVKLTYDETALVNVREYCLNPKKYRFQ